MKYSIVVDYEEEGQRQQLSRVAQCGEASAEELINLLAATLRGVACITPYFSVAVHPSDV